MSGSEITRAKIVAGTILFGLCAPAMSGAAETNSPKAQLMELTGDKRVKVVWDEGTEKDIRVKFYDSKDDAIRELPFRNESGPTDAEDRSAPLLTADGRHVLTSVGRKENRKVMQYDTETKQVKTLVTGLGNYLIAVWTDPKTKRTWAYVNSTKDKGEAWNVAGGGPIFRFPIDKPEARELFWDRTSSHFYLAFSADGTRALLEPSWGNIGQLKLTFAADGKVDQDKSEYKAFGGGCFPGFAPDNSYRLFRLEGAHTAITMCNADNANKRPIDITQMLKDNGLGGNCWLTKWSTHPRYMTCIAPAGPKAMVWLGRFDEECTKIEKWVRVSESGAPQCWLSQAWIAESAADNDGGPLIPMQAWTNSDGRQIQAAVQKVEGKKVMFRMADGRLIAYPMEKLSAESRKVIVAAAGIAE